MPPHILLYQLARDYMLPRTDILTRSADHTDVFLFKGFEVGLVNRVHLEHRGGLMAVVAMKVDDGPAFEAILPPEVLEAIPVEPKPGPPAFSRLGRDVWED